MTSSEPYSSPYRKDEIDVVSLLRVVWEFKYIIALVASVFVIAALYLALTATPRFRAEVVVTQVRDGNLGAAGSLASQFGGLASLAGVNLASGNAGQEAQAVLNSRHLVEQFFGEANVLAEYTPEGGDPPSLWLAVSLFIDTVLTINDNPLDGTTSIVVLWTDPAVAARWANELVALANELIRARALEEATKNIEYLNEQIENTTVVEVQRVMYSLIEEETKTLMLANARSEYAFRIVDPAVAPEERYSPNRKLIVLSGGFLGLFVGTILALAINLLRRIRNDA